MNKDNLHNEIEDLKDFRVFNVDDEWEQFRKKVDASDDQATIKDSSNSSPSKVVSLPRYFSAIAAGLLVLIVSTIAFLNLQKEESTIVHEPTPNLIKQVETPIEVETPVEQTIHPSVSEEQNTVVVTESKEPIEENEYRSVEANEVISLEDGSTVEILTASLIKVPKTFEGSTERLINLKSGSAIFDVVESPDKPFKVLTDNAGVSVLGTSFRLIKDGLSNTLKTITGEVNFYSLSDESINATVAEGQEFVFDGNEMLDVTEEEEEVIEEQPALEMGKYNLKAIQNSWSQYYSDNVKLKLKSIDKDIQSLPFEFPKLYISSGDPERITKGIELLKNEFDVDVEKLDDCQHCYKINSIKAKK
jgi:hypothetical protein